MNIDNVIKIVQSCKDIIMKNNSNLTIVEKGKADYVTQIDYDVQSFLKEKLFDILPDSSFVSEEQAENDYTGKLKWILDPIDGTSNLIHHYRQSAVSLALAKDNEIQFGIIYNPYSEETFWGIKGQGSFLNNERIFTSNISLLQDTLIAIGTSPYDKKHSDELFKIVLDIFNNTQDIRRTGSAAIDLTNVAMGRVDGFIEPKLRPWDYAAGVIIVKEAGGKISSWNKEPLSLSQPDDVIATNSYIYDDFINIVRRYKV